MSAWDMYWLLRLDGIRTATESFSVLSGILATLGIILYIASCEAMNKDDAEAEIAHKFLKRPMYIISTLFVFFIFLVVALPTTKQMAAIIVVPKIVNNEQIQEIPENLLELCNEWTKDKIKEIKGTDK